MVHVEFVIAGPPISNQSKGINLPTWRAAIAVAAQSRWNRAALTGKLKAIIINFHDDDKPSVDLDNMSKPILDIMQNIVYEDDRQLRQAEFTHVRIDAAFVIAGVSEVLVSALREGSQFVYVRIEDPADPFPLPK